MINVLYPWINQQANVSKSFLNPKEETNFTSGLEKDGWIGILFGYRYDCKVSNISILINLINKLFSLLNFGNYVECFLYRLNRRQICIFLDFNGPGHAHFKSMYPCLKWILSPQEPQLN